MNQEEFEAKWLHKKVRIKQWTTFAKSFPDKLYSVTAALYHFDKEDESIFAIIAEDYNAENKHWFTIYLKDENLHTLEGLFTIE